MNIIYMEQTIAMMLLHVDLGREQEAKDILSNSIMKETSNEPKVRYFMLNYISEQR